MSLETTIQDRLVAARKSAGYETASDAARAYGWNENTYRSHENGERGLKQSVAEKYSRAFNVSLAYLLTGAGVLKSTYSDYYLPIYGNLVSSTEIVPAAGPRTGPLLTTNFNVGKSVHVAELEILLNFKPVAVEVSSGFDHISVADGDLIVAEDAPISIAEASNRFCLLEIDKEKYFLNSVLPTEDGSAVLMQTSLRLPPRQVIPTYIAPIALIVPRGRWRRLSRPEFGALYPAGDA